MVPSERNIYRRAIWFYSGEAFANSYFIVNRRSQTNNRPALVGFVDFMSAFDKMWHPALISTLVKLDFPVPLLRWTVSWLEERSISIHVGDAVSRSIDISVGAPQGSVLAATLFRLHVHFLPSFFKNLMCYLFADDLTIVLTGALESRFSINVKELEKQAKGAMKILEKYADDNLLPVNINKTKAILVHDTVDPSYPKVKYKNRKIEFVKRFKYLDVDIITKLGWGIYIDNRLKKVRKIYHALRILFKKIPTSLVKLSRKLLFAYALPHIMWLFSCWFFYTELQQRRIEHVYCTGLRLTYNLNLWEDLTIDVLTKEFTLNDYLYRSPEAHQYQLSFNSYLAAKTPQRSWYLSMGMRSNSKFLNRLSRRAKHTKVDIIEFLSKHHRQYGYFRYASFPLYTFLYKYLLASLE